MTGPTGSHRRAADDAGTTTTSPETRFSGNTVRQDTDGRGAAPRDIAPGDDNVTHERADYAPTGADPKPNTVGTFKRMLKEVSQDNLTDHAAALTYYGVLAMFPAAIALISIVGLVFDPQQIAHGLTGVLNTIAPGSAAKTFSGKLGADLATAGFLPPGAVGAVVILPLALAAR